MEKSNKLSLKVSVRIKPSSDTMVSTRETSKNGFVSVDSESFGRYTSIIPSRSDQNDTFGSLMKPLVDSF